MQWRTDIRDVDPLSVRALHALHIENKDELTGPKFGKLALRPPGAPMLLSCCNVHDLVFVCAIRQSHAVADSYAHLVYVYYVLEAMLWPQITQVTTD